MNIRRWLTAHEARSLVWRSAGVVAAAATGLLSIKIFLAAYPEQAPGLIAMVGWLGFLPLLQLGLGRPAYGVLRQRFIGQLPIGAAVRQALVWFGALALLATIAHAMLSTWIVSQQGKAVSWFEVGLFAAGLAANGTGVFQRDLAYAISYEERYERSELMRRLVVLAGYGALLAGLPMPVVGAALLITGAATQAAMARTAVVIHPMADAGERPLAGLAPDACRYSLFSLNELLLYNLPLVIFTMADARPELIYVGIWTRLFQMLVLPTRMLVDARVNRQTAAWFRGDTMQLRHELALSLGLASATAAVSLVALIMVASPLLDWLGSPALAGDGWLLASLALWGAGNVVQHVYGSFTLSHGKGFTFAMAASTCAVVVVGLVFLATHAAGFTVASSLAAMGIAYALSSFAYPVYVQRLIAHRHVGSEMNKAVQ